MVRFSRERKLKREVEREKSSIASLMFFGSAVLTNDQNVVEFDDERVTLANLIANLKLDVDENKKIQKQLKKANTSLTQELTECKSILAETSRTLGQSNRIRDSCLVALQTKQTEFEKYKACNDRTVDYDKLKRKLNETLGLLAQKDIDIKEGLKLKAYEISVVKEKHDELVKQCLLTKSHYEGLVKEKIKDKNIAISKLKKLIEKCKGKSVETKFDKPSIVRQLNAQRIPKPSVLGKSAPFSRSLERKSFSQIKWVPKANVSESLSKPVTTQILHQTARQAISDTKVIKPAMYQINNRTPQTRPPQLPQTFRNTNPSVSTSTRVIHKTNVSRPQLRRNQMNKVVPNNNQVKDKKTEVEDHHRISSISNTTKSVTACNDSLKSRTSNVNAVCATCEKCLIDSNHFACVTKLLHDVNARTKKLNIVHLILFIVDSGCIKQMTGNISLLDLKGNDLLTGNRGSDLYTISLQETNSSTPICLMSKASPTQAWLWHRRLSHLNFDYINLLSKKDVMIGFPKLKYVKDQLCSSCEVSKAKQSSFKTKTVPSLKGWLNLLHMDLCGLMRIASINGKKYILAEAIATACYTQNRSIIILTYEKTAYHIINDRKPLIKHLYNFSCICYLTRNGENLDKMKEKGDPYILVRYSTQSKGYHVYNKRTRLIVKSIHLKFDEIKEMSKTSVANDTSGLVPQRQKASDNDNSDPVPQIQNVLPLADTTVSSQKELDLLFGPFYDEFFNAGTSSVNKSSSLIDNSKQRDTPPTMNIQSTTEPTIPPTANAKENNDNQTVDEFTNPFCIPV
nr:retrovirus-related Pol polyprotein from transposon TNT 1-94 [Tanacetum cinerariifolium]